METPLFPHSSSIFYSNGCLIFLVNDIILFLYNIVYYKKIPERSESKYSFYWNDFDIKWQFVNLKVSRQVCYSSPAEVDLINFYTFRLKLFSISNVTLEKIKYNRLLKYQQRSNFVLCEY